MPRQISLYLSKISRFILGCVFIYASYDKITLPAEFARAIYNYRLFPVESINLIAILLPWLELIIGLALITGIFIRGAAALSLVLNLIFIIALSSALLRGLDISCGCFSLDEEASKIGIFKILEDLFFLACSVYLLIYYEAVGKVKIKSQ